VFNQELIKKDPQCGAKYRLEQRRYYIFRTKMFFLRLYLSVLSFFGIMTNPDQMKEFEFDV
jgi:hypothetical protein